MMMIVTMIQMIMTMVMKYEIIKILTSMFAKMNDDDNYRDDDDDDDDDYVVVIMQDS